jgi:hypothetical protein
MPWLMLKSPTMQGLEREVKEAMENGSGNTTGWTPLRPTISRVRVEDDDPDIDFVDPPEFWYVQWLYTPFEPRSSRMTSKL